MLIATIPALFALAGVLVFALASGKPSQAGLAVFTAGMIAVLIVLAHVTVKIG